MKLKDSGKRTKYGSGAIREDVKGRGRPSLMPLDIVDRILEYKSDKSVSELNNIEKFKNTRDTQALIEAVTYFIDRHLDNRETAMLELAIHFEQGAKKYSDNNWKKGIPEDRYIDGAVRHYLKFKRGDKDEPHDTAFIWNIVCLIWTVENVEKTEG